MDRSVYTPARLTDIGEHNFNRLPPATSIQGMLAYELQRDAKHERLFNAAFFDVASVKDETTVQKSRLEALERTIKACISHHKRNLSFAAVCSVDDALKTLTSATDLQDPKAVLQHCDSLSDELDQANLSTEEQVTLIAVLGASHTNEMNSDIQKLREGYEATKKELTEVNSRISKLEDLVRALTLQKGPSPELPKMTQYLQVTTSDGQILDLGVQKGTSLKSSKGNTRCPSPGASSAAPSSPKHEAAFRDGKQVTNESDIARDGKNTHSSTGSNDNVEVSSEQSAQGFKNEKPLPPVPVAHAFPSLPKKEMQLKEATPSLFGQQASVPSKENSQPASTGQTAKQPSSSKAKKWKEPPLFTGVDDSWPPAKAKTLFTYIDSPSFEGKATESSVLQSVSTATKMASNKMHSFCASASTPALLDKVQGPLPPNDLASCLPLRENKALQNTDQVRDENKASQTQTLPLTNLVANAMERVASERGGASTHITSESPKNTSTRASMHAEATAPRAPATLPAQARDMASLAGSAARTESSSVSVSKTTGRLPAKRSGIKMVALDSSTSTAAPSTLTPTSTSTPGNFPATPATQVIKSPPIPPTPAHSTSIGEQQAMSPVANKVIAQTTRSLMTPPSLAPPMATHASSNPLPEARQGWASGPPTNTGSFQPSARHWGTLPTPVGSTIMSPPSTGPSSIPRTPAPAVQATSSAMNGSAPAFQPTALTATESSRLGAPRLPDSVRSLMAPDKLEIFQAKFNFA